VSAPVFVLATRNAGKRDEVMDIVGALGWRVQTLDEVGIAEREDEESLEAFDTFEANALAKARWFFARSGGVAVLADDSGLVVDALDGRPGVHSKRWSGATGLTGAALVAANNARLADALIDVRERSARFVCAAACVWSGGEAVVLGAVDGQILEAPRGSNGFGYDPWFFSPELGSSFAEATRAAKNRVSHRARAFAALAAELMARGVGAVDLEGRAR
jgi:XTP/dITP diphosphohydrolase